MKTSSKNAFMNSMEQGISAFGRNNLIEQLQKSDLTMESYHRFLKIIFHQVYSSATTFALAGVNCPDSKWLARDYLIKHAEEEKDHWKWIIEDLKNTGYKGTDPKEEFPNIHCQNYISFNYYISIKYPIARLGIAAVLEGIGAKYAKANAQVLCKKLSLKPEQAQFIFGHGDTDIGHTREILDVLDKSNLSDLDWGWMEFASKTAGELYRKMYDEVLK